MSFEIKDSGKREQFSTGMQRDTAEDKVRYDLVFLESVPISMFHRYAEHLTKGAKKYEERNFEKAETEAELKRFKQSAIRHFVQWLRGDTDEDHAAAIWFNVEGAEMVKYKLNNIRTNEDK